MATNIIQDQKSEFDGYQFKFLYTPHICRYFILLNFVYEIIPNQVNLGILYTPLLLYFDFISAINKLQELQQLTAINKLQYDGFDKVIGLLKNSVIYLRLYNFILFQ